MEAFDSSALSIVRNGHAPLQTFQTIDHVDADLHMQYSNHLNWLMPFRPVIQVQCQGVCTYLLYPPRNTCLLWPPTAKRRGDADLHHCIICPASGHAT
jgi:hypothetical protein